MPQPELQKTIDEMAGFIRCAVASGFGDLDELPTTAVEVISEQNSDDLRPYAERLVKEAIMRQQAVERTWPSITDCDRLDAAFAELERAGIVCRQNFTCCGACGAAEIGDEIEEQRNLGREICGYAFYHWQDTERAVEGGGLYLSYGSILQGEKAALSVAHQIVCAMREKGLTVVWDGSWSNRIFARLDWKRRRFTNSL